MFRAAGDGAREGRGNADAGLLVALCTLKLRAAGMYP
jgi:hypothetical protein